MFYLIDLIIFAHKKFKMKKFWNNYIEAYKGLSNATWILALVMFINRSGAMVVPFLGVYLNNSLGFDLEDAGIVLSCFGIGSIIGGFTGGYLTDKLGSFKIQTFSLFACIPIYLYLPQLQDFMSLCIGITCLSTVTEILRPANSASVYNFAKPENLTRAFSLNRMALNLGYSIGPAIGGFIAAYSFDWLFYTNAIMIFCAGIIYFFYFKNRQQNEKNQSVDIPRENIVKKSAYKDVKFIWFSIFVSLYAFCFFQILNTLPLFYKNEVGLNEKEVGFLIAFSGIIVFLLEMVIVHYVEHKFSVARILIYGSILCGLTFLVLIPSQTILMLYFSMFLLCISEILVMPFTATVAANRSNHLNRGSYMAINGISFSIANVFSPLFGTKIANIYGFNALWLVNGSVILIACFGFYWIMKKM